MANASYDVLIIGAGAAGLAAAAELARAGRSTLVLEARDRIGGRCWSRHIAGLPSAVELGAEFIHGRPATTLSELREAGSASVDAPCERWIVQDGTLVPRDDFFAEIRAAMLERRIHAARDVSFDAYLARELRFRISERALAFARMMVEGYDAADPVRASARVIIGEWTNEGAGTSLSRPLDGYGALLAHLAARAGPVRLQTVVRTVRWRRGSVEIDAVSFGTAFRATAPRAIITLPIGVLQVPAGSPGAVRFTPVLKEKRAALGGLAAGPVIKIALHFRAAFWEDLDRGRYRDATFFHAPGAAFPTFWTALPVRVPLLVAWSGGPNAARHAAGAQVSELVRQALISLRAIFGERARAESLLTAAYLHDWQHDLFAHGAYSYVTVGGEHARQTLAANLKDTLYFAGEATDLEGEAGTVAGALQSGRRAAREVMGTL